MNLNELMAGMEGLKVTGGVSEGIPIDPVYDYAVQAFDGKKLKYSSREFGDLQVEKDSAVSAGGQTFFFFERKRTPVKKFSLAGPEVFLVPEYVKLLSPEELSSLLKGTAS